MAASTSRQLLGICISWHPAFCLAPSPGPQFVFTGPVSPEPGLAYTNIVPPPQFVFTGPALRFLLPRSEFTFTFLSIVVAAPVVILAIVVIS